MKLISITTLVNAAKACGFAANLNHDGSYAEIYTPDHGDSRAVLWGGCVYSNAEIIVSDRPSTGYGYNCFFYGPFHPGLCRSTDYGVQKLLSHPAMNAAAI